MQHFQTLEALNKNKKSNPKFSFDSKQSPTQSSTHRLTSHSENKLYPSLTSDNKETKHQTIKNDTLRTLNSILGEYWYDEAIRCYESAKNALKSNDNAKFGEKISEAIAAVISSATYYSNAGNDGAFNHVLMTFWKNFSNELDPGLNPLRQQIDDDCANKMKDDAIDFLLQAGERGDITANIELAKAYLAGKLDPDGNELVQEAAQKYAAKAVELALTKVTLQFANTDNNPLLKIICWQEFQDTIDTINQISQLNLSDSEYLQTLSSGKILELNSAFEKFNATPKAIGSYCDKLDKNQIILLMRIAESLKNSRNEPSKLLAAHIYGWLWFRRDLSNSQMINTIVSAIEQLKVGINIDSKIEDGWNSVELSKASILAEKYQKIQSLSLSSDETGVISPETDVKSLYLAAMSKISNWMTPQELNALEKIAKTAIKNKYPSPRALLACYYCACIYATKCQTNKINLLNLGNLKTYLKILHKKDIEFSINLDYSSDIYLSKSIVSKITAYESFCKTSSLHYQTYSYNSGKLLDLNLSTQIEAAKKDFLTRLTELTDEAAVIEKINKLGMSQDVKDTKLDQKEVKQKNKCEDKTALDAVTDTATTPVPSTLTVSTAPISTNSVENSISSSLSSTSSLHKIEPIIHSNAISSNTTITNAPPPSYASSTSSSQISIYPSLTATSSDTNKQPPEPSAPVLPMHASCGFFASSSTTTSSNTPVSTIVEASTFSSNVSSTSPVPSAPPAIQVNSQTNQSPQSLTSSTTSSHVQTDLFSPKNPLKPADNKENNNEHEQNNAQKNENEETENSDEKSTQPKKTKPKITVTSNERTLALA